MYDWSDILAERVRKEVASVPWNERGSKGGMFIKRMHARTPVAVVMHESKGSAAVALQ